MQTCCQEASRAVGGAYRADEPGEVGSEASSARTGAAGEEAAQRPHLFSVRVWRAGLFRCSRGARYADSGEWGGTATVMQAARGKKSCVITRAASTSACTAGAAWSSSSRRVTPSGAPMRATAEPPAVGWDLLGSIEICEGPKQVGHVPSAALPGARRPCNWLRHHRNEIGTASQRDSQPVFACCGRNGCEIAFVMAPADYWLQESKSTSRGLGS
jgi:hypothetical protein